LQTASPKIIKDFELFIIYSDQCCKRYLRLRHFMQLLCICTLKTTTCVKCRLKQKKKKNDINRKCITPNHHFQFKYCIASKTWPVYLNKTHHFWDWNCSTAEKSNLCFALLYFVFFLTFYEIRKISLESMSWYRSVYVCCYSIHCHFNVIIYVGWPTIHKLPFKHNQSDRCILFWTIISLHFTTFYHAFSFQ
jgi:hypothetical protein